MPKIELVIDDDLYKIAKELAVIEGQDIGTFLNDALAGAIMSMQEILL
nr:hypothetical protein [Candidatus Sigynarchaeota archaeon]